MEDFEQTNTLGLEPYWSLGYDLGWLLEDDFPVDLPSDSNRPQP